jgi:hypothetical protein
MNQQPIVFLHLPKCAGTSIRRALEADTKLRVIADYEDKVLSSSLKHRLKRLSNAPQEIQSDFLTVYFGHFRMKKYGKLNKKGARTATFLRDPVERYISHVNHWMLNPDPEHKLSMVLNSGRVTPIELVERSKLSHLYEFMMNPLRVDEFDFVGVQEQFSKSIEIFNSTFNLAIQPKQVNTLAQALSYEGRRKQWLPTKNERESLKSIFDSEIRIYNDALRKLGV